MSGTEQSTRMAWAVFVETGSITHVSTLGKAQKGLQCGCICPSCKGTLQAVNVDKEASHFEKPNTRGQFFRHASGQQTNGCAIIAARMAALHLLYSHDSIMLPTPMQRVSVRGASGYEYVGIARGEVHRSRIRHRVWVDEQRARLTLDDGRVIQIQLSGVTELQAGTLHGIIEIKIDDPEVSSWSPDDILRRATLDGGTMCWISHWDDQALSDSARRDAEEQAAQNSDLVPPELAHLVGQATSMISETVLHWVVKEILAEAQAIKTPGHNEEITAPSRIRPRVGAVPLRWNSETLQLSDARLEQRVGDVIPDIRCIARDSSGRIFDLFVEVVVTNPVSDQKLMKIKELGSACLEIDLRKLRISGRVKRDRLRQELIHEIGFKTWLYHPHIEAARQIALSSLDAEVQRQEVLFKKNLARVEELTVMSLADLVREFVLSMRWDWADVPADTDAWAVEELVAELKSRGFTSLSDRTLTPEHGLLWCLEAIRSNKSPRGQMTKKTVAEIFSMATRDKRIAPYITILIRAVQKYRPPKTAQQHEFLKQSFAAIRSSIERGDLTYARPDTHDSLVAALHPELAEDISNDFGTEKYVSKLRDELAEKRRQEEKLRIDLIYQQRLSEQEVAAQAAAEETRLAYEATFEALSTQQWNQDRGMSRYPEQAQQNVRYVGRGGTRIFLFDKFALVKSAWEARHRGQQFAEWLALQIPRTPGNLQDCLEVLVAAALVR